jgi:ADP-ribose pyrophosphatase YjhB (NUDIX family)
MIDCLRRAFESALRRVLHVYWRCVRGMTLGVRALVIDGEGRVFLVRHSYARGWHLPGGVVEPGETLREALARALREESNIELTGPAAMHGMFHHARSSRRDYVSVFVVRNFRQVAAPVANREIVAHGFYFPYALPEGTSAATRARIAEVLGGAPAPDRW